MIQRVIVLLRRRRNRHPRISWLDDWVLRGKAGSAPPGSFGLPPLCRDLARAYSWGRDEMRARDRGRGGCMRRRRAESFDGKVKLVKSRRPRGFVDWAFAGGAFAGVDESAWMFVS